MLLQGDQISDSVVIRGTTYRAGFLVVTKVFCEDVLEVGEIVKIVLRKSSLHMLVLLSEAARNNLGFFEALPKESASLVTYDSLGDYKPIIKRGDGVIFPFVLHHHVGPPPFDDGKLCIFIYVHTSKVFEDFRSILCFDWLAFSWLRISNFVTARKWYVR